MSRLDERLRWLGRRLATSWTLVLVISLIVGLAVAPYAISLGSASTGTVAVVPVEGGIDGSNAAAVTAMLQRARQDPSIDAVVLLTSSPGGGAAASEQLYLQVQRTAKQMPVVASVDAMAASGAYYTIAPANYVFAKPSSLVGSVGVFTLTPQQLQPIDLVIASGPDKLSGGSERDWQYNVESLRRAFVGAVFDSRGDRLELSREELSEAGFYPGGQAVANGLADEIGGVSDAIAEAARRAGLDSYNVEVLRRDGQTVRFLSRANFVASNASDRLLVSPTYFVGRPGENPATPTVVMLPPSVLAAADDVAFANETDGASGSDTDDDSTTDSRNDSATIAGGGP